MGKELLFYIWLFFTLIVKIYWALRLGNMKLWVLNQFYFFIHIWKTELPYMEFEPNFEFLYIGTNDAPYKNGLDILNEILDKKSFIKEKYTDCKKITFSTPTIHNNNEERKWKLYKRLEKVILVTYYLR